MLQNKRKLSEKTISTTSVPYFKSIFQAKSLKLKLKVIWSQLKKVSPAMVIFFLAFVDKAALMSFLGADLLVYLHEEKK